MIEQNGRELVSVIKTMSTS